MGTAKSARFFIQSAIQVNLRTSKCSFFLTQTLQKDRTKRLGSGERDFVSIMIVGKALVKKRFNNNNNNKFNTSSAPIS